MKSNDQQDMKVRKSTFQRIRNEAQRFCRRFPTLFGAARTKRRWRRICAGSAQEPVSGFDGTLYVLGDSHTNFFGGSEHIRFIKLFDEISTSPNQIPFIKTFHLGPATAFSLPRADSQARAWKKTEAILERDLMPRGSAVLLCFGEIDCRVHLLRQAEHQQKPLAEVARAVVDHYMTYAEWLAEAGFCVACWGAIATQKGGPSERGEFPVYGSEVQRNEATRIFNGMLEAECRRKNFRFCSIFEQMVDDRLETRAEYLSSDGCHLSQRAAPLLAKALLDAGILVKQGDRVEVVAGR